MDSYPAGVGDADSYFTDELEAQVEELSWLDNVIQTGGLNCGNCNQWRILQGREIERCKGCNDDAIDAYDLATQWEAADIGG